MSLRLATAATCAALAVWLGLVGALDAPGAAPSFARLPAGWHRSSARLVDLLMPRERISVGTFPMAVGGGGNCGREPVASIRRMRRGDALVSIQEYVVTEKMRRHLTQTFTARPAVRLRGLRDELESARGGPIYRATIPFSVRGRAFDALVYTAGRPSPRLRGQIESILAGLPLSN
jgi:hypothetical protein